jgi:putative endopeptidase
MLEMVNNIKTTLETDVDSMDWMSPQTKKQAHIKLAAQLDKIGYPDHWRDYSALEIRADSHLANVERAAAFEMDRQMKKIGEPLDRTEWGMTPPTVNAYEDAQTNSINFPAGILQPPFFDPTKDDVQRGRNRTFNLLIKSLQSRERSLHRCRRDFNNMQRSFRSTDS